MIFIESSLGFIQEITSGLFVEVAIVMLYTRFRKFYLVNMDSNLVSPHCSQLATF